MELEGFEDTLHKCLDSLPSDWNEILKDVPAEVGDEIRRRLRASQPSDDFHNLSEAELPGVSPIEDARTIGDYKVLNVIAVHGQGVIFRADHPHLNRQVVIKLSKDPLNPKFQDALIREGQALGALSHPNLAQIFDLQFENDRPYLVMEYIDGENLADKNENPQQTPLAAAKLIRQIASAIDHAHQLGIIHCDLKPANIVIRAIDGMPKVIDFGLASTRSAFVSDSLQSSYGGTLAYMAPEQAARFQTEGASTEPRLNKTVDVFSIGAMLYEMLTGNRLYDFTSKEQAIAVAREGQFDRAALNRASIPRVLRQICLDALESSPAERLQSAREMADRLDVFIESTESNRWGTRYLWPTLVAAGVITLVSLGAYWLPDKSNDNAKANVSPTEKASFGGPNFDSLVRTEFVHFANQDGVDTPGPLFLNGPVKVNDGLRIHFEFPKLTYCFLFAINPDQSLQLCFPPDDKQSQPQPVTILDFPQDKTEGFAFTEGEGQQTFVLVTSETPLLSFAEWSKNQSGLETTAAAIKGTWIWDSNKIEPWINREIATRGTREIAGTPAAEEFIRKISLALPGAQTLGISFPIVDP